MTGHREESAAHLRKASEIKLRAALEADPTSARGFNDLGVLLVETGRVEEAVAQFEKAAALKPDFAAARANLGGALAKVGRLDEALVELRKAMESDARYAPAHYNLGLVLSRRGDAQGAIAGMAERAGARPEIRGSARQPGRRAGCARADGGGAGALARRDRAATERRTGAAAGGLGAGDLARCRHPQRRRGACVRGAGG